MQPFIAREISHPSVWEKCFLVGSDKVQGDAWKDLRTKKNALSFWNCEDTTEENCNEIILALAANKDHLEPIIVTLIEIKDIENHGIKLIKSAGETPVKDLKDNHVNAINLDLNQLAQIGYLIFTAIHEHKNIQRFRKKGIKEILQKAIQDKRLKPENLKPDVLRKLDI